jgi:hypothetical protein
MAFLSLDYRNARPLPSGRYAGSVIPLAPVGKAGVVWRPTPGPMRALY